MFIDRVQISIKAGNGGNGHVSFFRDKLTMKGGPDGGDGGHGGDVVFVGGTASNNLVDFRYNKKFKAQDGEHGGKRHRSGKSGDDLEIMLPLGTKIFKVSDTGKTELVADITESGQRYVALKGGAGGRGNAQFATARRQTPNFSQSGVITREHNVLLELNCIADVGLIGFPNVGKSTLLSIISRADPKIANYHFTTLSPNIGVANWRGEKFVIADIPGLIEGASDGAGLGIDFLKHINRTRLLVHVIDISGIEGRDAIEDFEKINRELEKFSIDLAKRPQIIALNKIDLLQDRSNVEKFKNAVRGRDKVYEISGATREGISELLDAVLASLAKLPIQEKEVAVAVLEEKPDKNKFEVEKIGDVFKVSGPLIENLIRGIVLNDTESRIYFERRLLSSGVIDELKKLGMNEGDTVQIADFEFTYVE